jgi:hypothetical protein
MMDAHVLTVMCNDFILLAIINIHVWFVYLVNCILYSICCSIVLKWIHDTLVYSIYLLHIHIYIYIYIYIYIFIIYSVDKLYCIYIYVVCTQ